jgi:hypothetical protein
MKIKITINGKTIEVEIDKEHLGIAFKYDNNHSQLIELISRSIEELKK